MKIALLEHAWLLALTILVFACDSSSEPRGKDGWLEGNTQAKFDTLMRRVDDATLRRAQVQRTRLEIDDAISYQKYDLRTPVEVTQEAAEPDGPTGPARLRLSFLGLLGGLGMGVALALLRKRLDRSYQRSDDLRLLLPGTVLITVPEVTPTGRRVVRGLTGISAALLLAAVFTGSLFILGVREQLWGSPEIVRDLLSFLTLS